MSEPEGLRTLRLMAALAGGQVCCAHGLTDEVVAAYFITDNDSCWHWSSEGLKQLSHLEMLNLRHLQGLAYYQEDVWEQIQIRSRIDREARASGGTEANYLSLLQQVLTRR